MAQYQVQDPTGQMHVIEGPDGASPDQIVSQAQSLIPQPEGPGALESGLRGAANNFPLAPQAIAVLEPGNYSGNLADWNAKAQAAKAAHPVAYGAGAISGSMAPLLIPGVGEALKAAPVVGNAALGAANAISNTDLTQNPLNTLKQAGEGAVVGGTIGKLTNALLPNADSLEQAANTRAVKSLNFQPGLLVDMTPEERNALGDFARSNNLVGANKEKVLDQARELMDQYGSKIGELSDKSESLGLHVDPAEHYQAVQSLLDKSNQYAGLANREAKALGRNYQAGANDILNLPDNPTWSSIQTLKDQYGSLAFKPNGEVKDEAAKDTYFALKDLLKGIADKAQGNPNLADEYKEALAGYSQMHPIVNGLEKTVDAELREVPGHVSLHRPEKLIESLPGPLRAIGGTAAALTGHPLVAAAAALPELTNPAIQSQVLSRAAQVAPSAKQAIAQQVGDYVTSKFNNEESEANPQSALSVDGILKAASGTPYSQMLNQAAQKGPQSVITNHYLLMQRDPEYNKNYSQMLQGSKGTMAH